MDYKHIPVMLTEVLEYLSPQPGDNFIDCTMGGGGYTLAIAEKCFPGKVLTIDLDNLAIKNIKQRIKDKKQNNLIFVQDNFRNLKKIVEENWPDQGAADFSGIVLDLGLSSAQLDDGERGFSFKVDAPIDMAFGKNVNSDFNTRHILNNWGEKELNRILKDYGEEKYARSIAKAIVKARKSSELETTNQLIEIISSAVPGFYKRKKIHFATRTFQALRIATNEELESLQEVLPAAVGLLKKGGRLVVVSYHSLEDRIVKQFFKEISRDCICPKEVPVCQCDHEAEIKILTKKVVFPTDVEVKENPRARSAKMRVVEKL